MRRPNSLCAASARRRVRIEPVNDGPAPLELERDDMHIEKVLGAGGRSFVAR
jgi:hypothetical protein